MYRKDLASLRAYAERLTHNNQMLHMQVDGQKRVIEEMQSRLDRIRAVLEDEKRILDEGEGRV